MFKGSNPSTAEKKSNVPSQIQTPKGIQSVGSGSHSSSRAMSIIPGETSSEIEKYDKFIIHVNTIFT